MGGEMTTLVGTWRLIKWQTFTNRCTGPSPMGETVNGQASYSADGTMSVFLARDGFSGQPGRESMVAYSAKWVLEGRKLSLDVTMATLPDIIGRRLTREIDLSDQRCVARTPPETNAEGDRIEHILTWERT